MADMPRIYCCLGVLNHVLIVLSVPVSCVIMLAMLIVMLSVLRIMLMMLAMMLKKAPKKTLNNNLSIIQLPRLL